MATVRKKYLCCRWRRRAHHLDFPFEGVWEAHFAKWPKERSKERKSKFTCGFLTWESKIAVTCVKRKTQHRSELFFVACPNNFLVPHRTYSAFLLEQLTQGHMWLQQPHSIGECVLASGSISSILVSKYRREDYDQKRSSHNKLLLPKRKKTIQQRGKRKKWMWICIICLKGKEKEIGSALNDVCWLW